MSFVYGQWAFALIGVALTVCYLFWSSQRACNRWVREHWFFGVSIWAKWALRFFLSGVFLLILAMADLRGPTQNVDADLALHRTVILLDVSLSMFTEDVRPNRLEKAVQVAKHFVRKAAGHSISLIIFSDTQKQLVPFTEDIDLLDARLNALRSLDLNRGGSSIKKAMGEALGYLAQKSSSSKRPDGNIVVISDADETAPEFALEVPDSVTIAYVAIGTVQGGRIALRTSAGDLRGYKKYQGKEVVSRVNEAGIKQLAAKVENFHYWVLSSYSIPTEEILLYLQQAQRKKFVRSQAIIRPVLMKYLVIPSIVCFIAALLLRMAPSYSIGAILLMGTILGHARASEGEEKQYSGLDDPLYHKFKRGEANKLERLKIAEKYLKSNDIEKALQIYQENLSSLAEESRKYREPIINYGTALIKSGRLVEGLRLLKNYKDTTQDQETKKLINENILALLKQLQQKQSSQGSQQQSSEQEGQGKKSSNSDDAQKGEGGKEQATPKVPSSGAKKSERKGENQPRQRNKKVKLPTLLKQLVDKDRKLQEKMLDTKTKSKNNMQKKDW